MPFDEGVSGHEPGGGGGPHDREGLDNVVLSALMSLDVAAEANEVCSLCSGVLLINAMIGNLIELTGPGDGPRISAEYALSVAAMLDRRTGKLRAKATAVPTTPPREGTKP